MSNSSSMPLVTPGKASHHFFRLIHPFIGISGLLDLRLAYLVSQNPYLPHQYHHLSFNSLEGFSNIMWAMGGMIQFEKEVLKLTGPSHDTNSVLSIVARNRLDSAFSTSRKFYRASYTGLIGMTMHHAVFGYMAHRQHDSKRTSAHVAAGVSSASYAYLWHSIFLSCKIQTMGVSHMTAIACMMTVWLTDSDRVLKII